MAINLDDLSYPFDPSGKLSSNLITNEQHILTPVNYRDYDLLIPRWAPYFAESMVPTITLTDGTVRSLVLGVDWIPCYKFLSASKATATPIWGGMSMMNNTFAGVVKLTYQTLGGIWTIDEVMIAELLAYELKNPRVTTWEEVVNPPTKFPPVPHEWDLVDMVGASEVVTAINGIETAIRDVNGTDFSDHINNFNNPHKTTAAQTGLDQVQNYPIATAQDIANNSNTTYMTPATTSLMIQGGTGNALALHLADFNNPHRVTAHETGAFTQDEVTTLLAGKVDTTGVAADSLKFNGRDQDAYKAFVLTGTASNSVLFDGKNSNDYAASVLLGKSADTARFNGQTPDAFTAAVLSGTAANATLAYGLTQQQLTNAILSSPSVGDASSFGGMSTTQYRDYVLTGKAADSALLNGQTPAQVASSILQLASTQAPFQTTFGPFANESAGTYWLEVARLIIPLDPTQFNLHPDLQWYICGMNSGSDTHSSLLYFHLNAKQAAPGYVNAEVSNAGTTPINAQVGYTVENVDNGQGQTVPTVRVWLKTSENLGQTTVTQLSKDNASFSNLVGRVTAEPNNITYLSPSASGDFASKQDLDDTVAAMATMFESLATSLNS